MKINLSASRETTNFTAEIFIDGKHVGNISNDGWGGSSNILPSLGHKQAIVKANDYCKTLPEIKAYGISFKMDLESYIMDIVEKEDVKKQF